MAKHAIDTYEQWACGAKEEDSNLALNLNISLLKINMYAWSQIKQIQATPRNTWLIVSFQSEHRPIFNLSHKSKTSFT